MKKDYYTSDIVETYGKDKFNIYSTVRKIANSQLAASLPNKEIDTLVDVAVGKGDHMLDCLEKFHIKHMIGNDISPSMLEYAKKELPDMQAVCDSADNISQHVQHANIVFAHFVLSYLPADKILTEINKILVPDGILSIATSTRANLSAMQQRLRDNVAYLLNMNDIHDKHTNGIPNNREEFLALLNKYGFEVIQEEMIKQTVVLKSFDDVWEFLVDEGWGIQYLDRTGNRTIDKLLTRIVIGILQLLHKPLRFPQTAETDICMVTCKKRKNID